MRYLPDVLAIAGAALVVYGMALAYAPSAYIIMGGFLFYTASRLPR